MTAPFKRILTVDFETRWDSKSYTLSKMTTEEYIRDPRFKAFGCCFHEYGTGYPIRWVSHKDLPDFLTTIDWSETAVLAHNAQFDVSILEWIYDVHPAFIFDTLSMARALRGVEVGNSAAKLADAFGLPPKGRATHSTDGLEELTPEIEEELAAYCKHDVWLCEQFLDRMLPGYPSKELRLIDMTVKMYSRPRLVLDPIMLTGAIKEEKDKREGLLQRLGVDEAVLASNPQFAELLESLGVSAPRKISKTTGESAFALAKNDALFQALLNGESEEVALLCEARLAVKSTLQRTRAQRFLDIAGRGPLPVPLSYFGAGTGRWTAAKGSAINMQNLKRGSFLRKAIMAPVDHMLVVGDLAQIEPRVLAWLADYDDLLEIFRSGEDVYAVFGSMMFNIPGMTKESHPLERQAAKSALLGCFGPDTPVLTQAGWKPIISVQATDTVWDGQEWVQHQGVVPQGEKDVLTALGISATSDHEILTEHGWREWNAVLQNRSLLKSALSLANSPVSGGNAKSTKAGGVFSIHGCVVHAAGKALRTATTLSRAAQHAVTVALNAKLLKHAGSSGDITQCARIGRTASGYLIASVQSLCAAPTQKVSRTQTMVAGVSRCIRDGLRTAFNSYATLLASMAGISQNFNLIASGTTKAIFPATSASQHAASTCRINGASLPGRSKRSSNASSPLKQKMQTYDIAHAGPRNRYTILTDEGPLIVHNCGYGLGWASFAAQLLVGFQGAPPVRYGKDFAKALGVDGDYIASFLDWDENVAKLEAIPHTCTDTELLIHCVATKKIVDKYRATAKPITEFWELMQDLIEHSLYNGKEYTHKCLTFKKGQIVLPSGMPMNYPNLRWTLDKKGRKQWRYGEGEGTNLYGGKVTNNVTQGSARVVMTDGMLRVNKRYPCVHTVHDELGAIAKEMDAEAAKVFIRDQMTLEPVYMPGIPLESDVGYARRYGDAK